MTLFDFEKYITERKPRCISFWSDNQPEYDVACPCKMALSFDSITVSTGVNIITLLLGANTPDVSKRHTMFFDRVLSVEIDETKAQGIFTVITVICGSREDSTDRQAYVLVAD